MSRNSNNQFSNSRLTTAAVFAFLPFSGIFGIHNFILKQYGKGVAHIIIVVSCWAPNIIANTLCDRNSNCFNVIGITMLLLYLAVSSYIWAIVEGVRILQSKNQGTIPSRETSNPDSIQASNPAMKAEDANYSTTDILSPETTVEIKQERKQDRKVWSILSILATTTTMIIWIDYYIVSSGGINKNGPGAIWWLMVMYYWSLGIPLTIVSIAFGIIGLKTSLRWLSIISLVLKATMIVAIIPLSFTY